MNKLHSAKQKSPEFYVVIPARYASTRLPGKPLLDIAGKPMVVHVAERAKLSGAKQVVVATDDLRIVDAVNKYGLLAMLTRDDHVSGTDRIAEVVAREGWHDDAIVINVQGDEPLIDTALIMDVATMLANNNMAVMATACHALHTVADFVNPNVVKVVLDKDGHALYFSRSPIPYPRDGFANHQHLPKGMLAYRHIGLYAYRAQFLKQYASLAPSALEHIESLEQLRVLYHGFKIAVAVSNHAPATGVDTEADIARVRALMES
ncbi:MAG: 3-deoxy-manno-octulosonate cytidylyltransferase [Methylotenera sp.]|nr:3-deoxy-manno-octulosonate cytidylyltransferase [Methylotenera sp.]